MLLNIRMKEHINTWLNTVNEINSAFQVGLRVVFNYKIIQSKNKTAVFTELIKYALICIKATKV